jgi:hypothetical protein
MLEGFHPIQMARKKLRTAYISNSNNAIRNLSTLDTHVVLPTFVIDGHVGILVYLR